MKQFFFFVARPRAHGEACRANNRPFRLTLPWSAIAGMRLADATAS
jgi:hypothetical protein